MSERLKRIATYPIVIGVGLVATYGMAQLGEPQSVWLWSLITG